MMATQKSHPYGPIMSNFQPSLLHIASCLLLVAQATAHEHHNDDIPEGQAISAEPLVSLLYQEKL